MKKAAKSSRPSPRSSPPLPPSHEALLATLQSRFQAHPHRHPGVVWSHVLARLLAYPDKLQGLAEMERTGGEPDVISPAVPTSEFLFVDCAPQSPPGRRSLCYDRAALDARKANKPAGSAVELAATFGARLLTEAEYRHLQTLGEFDTKTSSWIDTPAPIRALGGALFCDRRYGQVFLYHNGADSYYAARAFRAALTV